jgi:hypothetical protein
MFYFDPLYFVFTVPVFLFAMWAQYRVKSSFAKWAQVPNAQRLTGDDVAAVIRRGEGLEHVGVERVAGQLTDHYDPRAKVIRLSDSSVAAPSVAGMAVVAHELGHAAQDKEGYFWLRARAGIVGIANLGSQLGTTLFFIGLLLSAFGGQFGYTLAWIGVILFCGAVAFTLVTLPVEFNASARAKEMLIRNNLVSQQEMEGVNAVLGAAALTYVAAAAQAIAQLLYFISILQRRDR